MRKLLKYLKDYKKESMIGPLFKLLEACFELVVPLIMANMIDIGIRNGDTGYILRMGSILILFAVLGLSCSLTAQYFAAKASVGFGTALRHDMFRHIQSLSYAEIDRAGSSTLVTRITSDINQVQSGVNLVLRLFLRSPFIVVGAMLMAFTISVKLALIFVVAVPLLSLVIYGIMVVSIPLYRQVQKRLDRILLSTRENLEGIRVIRAFGMQAREREEFKAKNTKFLAAQMLVGKISALLNPATYIIVNVATIAIVWFGGRETYAGGVTQGEVIALVNYMTQILTALVALSNLIVSFTKALACANRVNEVFDLEPSIQDPSVEELAGRETSVQEMMKEKEVTKVKEAVAFHQVSFAYPKSKVYAVTGLNFSVKQGEMIGIIGGTGSGKSTLVQMIPRFYDVTEGSVTVDGRDVRDYKIEELRQKIGMVPQRAVLFRGTIRDNMRVGNELADDVEIMEAVKRAQALEVVEGKPDGLDTMINEGGKNLSGGQRQRLTIARAFVRKPQILILDDSASALDFATDARLRKAVRDLKDMTVFVVSQRAASVMQADRIMVMDDGKLVGIGTHEELMETCEVYREICLSQLSEKEVGRHA